MKSTLFCCCLATLIVALPNSEVHGRSMSLSSARYTGSNEQNKITNSSSYSKISSTSLPPSYRKTSDRQEPASVDRQDTRRNGEFATITSQTSTRSYVNVSTAKVVTEERQTSTPRGERASSQNQIWRSTVSDQAYNTPTSKNSERSKTGVADSPLQGRTDNEVASAATGFRAESTPISTTAKWTSAPSRLTSSKVAARPTTAASFTARSSSTTAGSTYSSTTDSWTSRADKPKASNDAIVFPAASSGRTTPKTATSTISGNAITVSPSVNGTGNSTNDKIDTKYIIDVPELRCKDGEKKDAENNCREILDRGNFTSV